MSTFIGHGFLKLGLGLLQVPQSSAHMWLAAGHSGGLGMHCGIPAQAHQQG
jgi:hypothetical protein